MGVKTVLKVLRNLLWEDVAYFLGMWTIDSHSSSHSAMDPQAAWAGLLLAPGLAYR